MWPSKAKVGGGSFSVMVAKKTSPYFEAHQLIETILKAEEEAGLRSLQTYSAFALRVAENRTALCQLMAQLKEKGKKIIGYGASTKGNVLLQYCGITTKHLDCIAEVNEDKFGSFTPGSLIPIVSETEGGSRSSSMLEDNLLFPFLKLKLFQNTPLSFSLKPYRIHLSFSDRRLSQRVA